MWTIDCGKEAGLPGFHHPKAGGRGWRAPSVLGAPWRWREGTGTQVGRRSEWSVLAGLSVSVPRKLPTRQLPATGEQRGRVE